MGRRVKRTEEAITARGAKRRVGGLHEVATACGDLSHPTGDSQHYLNGGVRRGTPIVQGGNWIVSRGTPALINSEACVPNLKSGERRDEKALMGTGITLRTHMRLSSENVWSMLSTTLFLHLRSAIMLRGLCDVRLVDLPQVADAL